ncbi:amino acid adenylation domain-containing protein [Streptomyces sp. NPDC057682]|uniref:amino acid adenylation domain-containing protein n=1 Tax=unclassified Streptomyces TaxID=2593676 RepID=UPI00364C6755
MNTTTATMRHPEFQRVEALFAQQVLRTPDRVALVDGDRNLTYAQVDERSRRIAGLLAGNGVVTGDPVGVDVDRTADLPIALLGVLRAGGGYVPLDRSYPAERLGRTARAARLRLVLSDGDEPPEWVPEGVRVLPLRADDDLARFDGRARPVDPGTDSIAYVLFTSGSTGRPKGVAMPHRGLANLLPGQGGPSGLDGPARTLQFAPAGFDVASQEIFPTWLSGGTLVMLPAATRLGPFALLDHLVRHRVERMILPVVALDMLCRAICRRKPDLSALKDVAVAGEQLRITAAMRAAFGTHLRARLHNQYGPTETHMATAHTLSGDPAAWPLLPPIGPAVPGMSVLVAGPDRTPLPPGEAGELLIGGKQVALGYLHQPELTAERFVVVEGHGRMYRSGDLVRQEVDGTVHFLGRLDDQVKIRGFRVELGEVEAVAEEVPGVGAAAAVARVDSTGRSSLVLFVTGDLPDEDTAERVVRARLTAALPDYMLPARIRLVDRLPLTGNGKVDRKGLLASLTAAAV